MRIDQPSGSRATLEGSFSGSFTGSFLGEVQGLSSSFGAVYEHIDQISKSIDNTIQENSFSTSSSLFELSSSFSSSLSEVSQSISSSLIGVSRSIDESIVELYNLAVAKTGSLEAQGTIMLNTGARKTFQICTITSSIQKIYLQLSDTIQLDFEHRVLFKNNTTGSVEVNPPAHTLMPAAIEGRIDGGYANNAGNYFTVRPSSILLMTYYSVDGESIIISELEEFKEN